MEQFPDKKGGTGLEGNIFKEMSHINPNGE
jgi:hypothetical protein